MAKGDDDIQPTNVLAGPTNNNWFDQRIYNQLIHEDPTGVKLKEYLAQAWQDNLASNQPTFDKRWTDRQSFEQYKATKRHPDEPQHRDDYIAMNNHLDKYDPDSPLFDQAYADEWAATHEDRNILEQIGDSVQQGIDAVPDHLETIKDTTGEIAQKTLDGTEDVINSDPAKVAALIAAGAYAGGVPLGTEAGTAASVGTQAGGIGGAAAEAAAAAAGTTNVLANSVSPEMAAGGGVTPGSVVPPPVFDPSSTAPTSIVPPVVPPTTVPPVVPPVTVTPPITPTVDPLDPFGGSGPVVTTPTSFPATNVDPTKLLNNGGGGDMDWLNNLLIATGSLAPAILSNDATNDALDFQRDVYNDTRADNAPWQAAGTNSLNALTDPENGLIGGYDTKIPGYNGADDFESRKPVKADDFKSKAYVNQDDFTSKAYTNQDDFTSKPLGPKPDDFKSDVYGSKAYEGSPEYKDQDDFYGSDKFEFDLEGDAGYNFARDEAIRAVNRNAGASGKVNSGNRMAEIGDRVTGLASTYANDAYNRQRGTSDTNYGRKLAEYGIKSDNSKYDYGIKSDNARYDYGINSMNALNDYNINLGNDRYDYGINSDNARYDYGVNSENKRYDYGINQANKLTDYGINQNNKLTDYGINQNNKLTDYGINSENARYDYGINSDNDRYDYSNNLANDRYDYGIQRENENNAYGRSRNVLNDYMALAGFGRQADASNAAAGTNFANNAGNLGINNAGAASAGITGGIENYLVSQGILPPPRYGR